VSPLPPQQVQHKHLPELGPCTALPRAVPQWRDQHAQASLLSQRTPLSLYRQPASQPTNQPINQRMNEHRGNINRVRTREGVMHTSLFTDKKLESLYPVVDEAGSDSGILDNALQFYSMASSRSLPEALAIMVPFHCSLLHLTRPSGQSFHPSFPSACVANAMTHARASRCPRRGRRTP